MKQVEVSILGQTYLLACPEGGEARLALAVSAVDREMIAIRDAGRIKARERIAVLAALNIAYQQVERTSQDVAVPSAPPPPAAPAAGPSTGLPGTAELGALLQRLDDALAGDGHLF